MAPKVKDTPGCPPTAAVPAVSGFGRSVAMLAGGAYSVGRRRWFDLVRWRCDVAWWIGRWRRMRGGIRRGTDEGTHRDTRRNTTPVRSTVIAAVAAPATAADVHVATGVEVSVPIGTHIPIRAGVRRVARIRCIAVEVVAVEAAATGATCGSPLTAAAVATRSSPLAAAAPATSALLHQDHARRVWLDGYVDRSRHAGRRECCDRCSQRAD